MYDGFEFTLKLQISQTGVERVDVVAQRESLRHKVLDAPVADVVFGLRPAAVNRGHHSSRGGVQASDGRCLGAGRVQSEGAADVRRNRGGVAGLLGLDVSIGTGQARRARLCCRTRRRRGVKSGGHSG